MISIDLKHMVSLVAEMTGIDLTLTRIHEDTGVHRKILSKLNNDPYAKASTETLEALIEYFFHIFRHSPQRPKKTDCELMDWVKCTLIAVYPENEKYQDLLPNLVKAAMSEGKAWERTAWLYFTEIEKTKELELIDLDFTDFTMKADEFDYEAGSATSFEKLLVKDLVKASDGEYVAKKIPGSKRSKKK